MAKAKPIDPAQLKRFAPAAQKRKTREIKALFLIVCEGSKTEPNYFKSFPKQSGNILYVVEIEGTGMNTTKVVDRAIEKKTKDTGKYDRIWAVFDCDSFPAKHFNGAIEKAEAHGIRCAWSNEAFELWYVLHFENRQTPMGREAYKKTIENAINAKNKKLNFRYQKNSKEMFALLKKYGNLDQAIKWARDLAMEHKDKRYANHNPSTRVHELVEELLGQSEALARELEEKHAKGE